MINFIEITLFIKESIMNRTILFIILLQLTSIVHQTHSCWFSNPQNRTICNSFEEANAEYKDEWYNLLVENTTHPLSLKANTFINMTSLQKLQVSSLKDIEPGAFNGLEKLDFLVFFRTELEEIPAEVYDGLKIRNIQIFDNKKFKILSPKYFENLPDIRQVDIRICDLGVIRSGVFNNTDIYKIYLDRDHIHTIEDNAFADMDGLAHLSLTDNQLKSFESKRIVGKSYTIKQFWLNKNQITRIDTELLEGLPVLQKLYIEVNEINYIEPGVFGLTPGLDFLDLSNNKLVEISPSFFPPTGMKDLQYFFLHNNRFTFLDKAVFYRVPRMSHVTYGGNPLQCTCEKEIKEIADRKNIIRLCENHYSLGERPTCITSELSSTDCIYDVELTANLYEDFLKGLEEYPVLRQQCDTTKGTANAQLTDVL